MNGVTPGHFLPLPYHAELAGVGAPAEAVVRGYSLGSFSMLAYASAWQGCARRDGAAAASLPADVPAGRTNTWGWKRREDCKRR